MKFIALLVCAVVAQDDGIDCVDNMDLSDAGGDDCGWYYDNDSQCGWWDTDEFTASMLCCACENPHKWDDSCVDNEGQDAGGDDC